MPTCMLVSQSERFCLNSDLVCRAITASSKQNTSFYKGELEIQQ
jgi:hypothetical protein